MKQFLSTITSKGQVTIPAEVRRLLRAAPRDKIAFLVEDDQVRLARTGSVVERTAGILMTKKSPRTARELREAAERAIAEEALRRSGE